MTTGPWNYDLTLLGTVAAGTCGSSSGAQGAVTYSSPVLLDAGGTCGSLSGAQGAAVALVDVSGTCGSISGAQGAAAYGSPETQYDLTLLAPVAHDVSGACGSISGAQAEVVWETLDAIAADSVAYDDATAVPGVPYQYRVAPVTGGVAGDGLESDSVALLPAPAEGSCGSTSGAQGSGSALAPAFAMGSCGSTSGAQGCGTAVLPPVTAAEGSCGSVSEAQGHVAVIVPPTPLEPPVASRTPAVFLLNRMTGNVDAVLSNVDPCDPADAGSCHFWADEHIEDLDGTLTYEFSCDALHDGAQFATMKEEVIFRDLDGEPRLVVIEKVDTLQEGDVHYKRVHCESAAQDELIGVPIRKVTYTSETATTILTGICAGSRWQPGQVDYDGIHTITFDNISALEALRAFEEESTLEVRERIVLSGSQITGRYIDLLTRRGSDTGKIVEYEKDLIGLTMTDDGMNLYTRHIPLGRANSSGNRLSIAGVTWTAPGDPMDKPAGEDYLDASEATALYGPGGIIPIARFIDLPDCVTAEALIHAAYPIHIAESQPQPTYEISVAFLEKAFATSPGSTAPYGQERMRLGDGITIRNRKLGVVTTQRIRRVVTSYSGLTSAPSLGGQ